MQPHSKTWRDLDTPLGRMGQRAVIHPKSTFKYSPHTDLRATFARIKNELRGKSVRAA